MEWFTEVLKKYAVFSGRARRKEYWIFTLVSTVISLVLGIVDASLGFTEKNGWGPLGGIYSLAVLVPSLAVCVRRLHDTGRSGWWILIGAVPCVGFIVLLVFLIQDSQPGSNEYGPNPKETTDYPPYNPYG